MTKGIAIAAVWFCLSSFLVGSVAAQIIPPANLRFAGTQIADEEVPDFQKHVAPLLGRLGCNGRSCHGSFQGRGDFRLSLFGYDFKMDHTALTAKASSRQGKRIRIDQPNQSLLIQKPTLQVDHEGGDRFENGSWQHRVLERWIAGGAKGCDSPRELKRLEISPREIVFRSSPSPVSLKIIAVWDDGQREDVTPLCRFRTNDDSVVTVDSDGVVTSVGPGDSHVIAFYDNGIAASAVMRPVEGVSITARASSPKTKIDEFVEAKLLKLGIVASDLCTDAEFLRRVSIDLTGTLPAPNEVTSFLAEQSADKRQRKIDELLDRPAYAAWWTNKLCDFTGCNPQQQAELGQETSVQWYGWINRRVLENMPYDRIVEQIMLAQSRSDEQSYDEYAKEVSSYFRENEPLDFANRESLPHYWSRRTMEKPEDKALALAHNFLGIGLQCAQCHKHPFAPWTQEDFQQFSKLLENVKFGVKPSDDKRYRELAKKVGLNVRGNNGSPIRKDVLLRAQNGATVPWRELYIEPRKSPVSLSLLRSTTINLNPGDDSRKKIMSWMRRTDNNWFSRAFVNRVWASYFHTGIVDPPDNLNPANPPSHPQLLDWLSESFIENDFDMKWLHRQVVSSDAYQRSWRPNESNRDDRRNFSRAIPRRIPAEIVYDGLKQAVAASDKLDEVRNDLTRRATGHLSMWLAGTYGMHVFGKPERAVNCDCERVNQPTLLQSIFIQNDPLVQQRLDESGWLQEIADADMSGRLVDHDELMTEAWLRTVSRVPTDKELGRAQQHLANADSVAEGMRDLMWALINTKEFILNR